MSKPTESLLARLGPAVLPFKRVNRDNQENSKKVGTGECISFASHLIHINSAGLDNVQFATRTNLIK
ncbi:hypothetical protein LNQ49_03925 [Flavobacterium sp. F-65]|uniref:Uncharacterized protein n=1 Tax=Flavobacterium pisciphilum TaxID=2893755 RepID=A0ABS8MPP7_9FLAO|nr:hypothetical protein [Flavobacterium sp. F-65]MCC9070749.1 hypothetical protein [Flavobacterium sp. F-65]